MSDGKKTALVTGAGQNIGRAIAVALATDGFNVVINGFAKTEACEGTAELVRAKGVGALVAMGDVGDPETCRRIVAEGAAKFGQIDVLVNNAAIRPETPTLEMDDAEWMRVLNVDMNAAFWLARACLPAMVDTGWGRIVNFAGANAIHGYAGRAHVSVAKHGVWGMTKAFAKEFGPKGIATNIISPGPIRSEHDDPEMTAHINSQVSRIPVGRLGEPDEVAGAVSFLASDKGGFVNGQMIAVNGGVQT